MPLSRRSRTIVLVFWILAIAAFPVWCIVDHAGYDVAIYHNAILSLKAGHDPYADAVAIQVAFHNTLTQHPNAITPFSYVYSPITLPLLRLMGVFPTWLAATLYWLVLISAAIAVPWVALRARQPSDEVFLAFVTPLALFFPGLLAHDTILSGNVAFILYAAVFLGAAYGWRTNRWFPCYLAILVASCFKAPLLSLIAIPVLSARKQWLPAGITAAASIALFAIQPFIWPSLFHNFLKAVELQFSYNRDFGSSPAGVFSDVLVHHGLPYTPGSGIFYLAYAFIIFAVLFHLSRRFLNGSFTLQQWIPVLLTGTILLNPRIMEYDAAPLALPMALIGWRFFTRRLATLPATLSFFALFLTANCIAVPIYVTWKPIECILLISFFTAGSWDLLHPLPIESPIVTSTHSHIAIPTYSEA